MSTEKSDGGGAFSPQYFMITKSEPLYDLIRNQVLASSPHPIGSSYYYVRADADNRCICRIRDGNGSVLFYETLNHRQMGLSDNDISDAVNRPSNASPLAGYYYLTPEIERKMGTPGISGDQQDRK